MSSVDSLRMLTRYKAWADDRLYRALADLPKAALIAPRPIVFGSILRTLNHVHAMDLVWRAHLEGSSHDFTTRNPEDCPTFAELRDLQRAMDAWYVAYARDLQPEVSDEVIDFTFIGGGEGSMSRADILLHVVNHATYHRGHIGDMVYQIPAEPPTTDLPVFLRAQAG